MSANDNKRYYWLKLKKDFFQQHQMKVLKALPNGRLYALIYLELLAESTSHDGQLRYSETLPYDIITLASVIDEDKDNLEKAIETFERLELVEILDDQTIYMRELDKLVGSETYGAERKRLQRGQCPPNVPKSIENKSIENICSCRYLEAGYKQETINQVNEIINSLNLKKLTSTIYSKIVDIVQNENIINKQEYAYTKALRKGWLNEIYM